MTNYCETFLSEISPLKTCTDPAWVTAVTSDWNAFLLDHAACERKAVAQAFSFIAKYPDRPAIVEAMVALAREEMEHYGQVYRLLVKANVFPSSDPKDEYVNQLMAACRHGRDERLLDKLIISGLIEARSCERFAVLAEHLEAGDLKEFYWELARSESGHYKLFFNLARVYFDADVIESRRRELADLEATILANLPHRPVVH